jgi:hypothetical protein
MPRYIILMFYNARPSATEIHTLPELENEVKCSCWSHYFSYWESALIQTLIFQLLHEQLEPTNFFTGEAGNEFATPKQRPYLSLFSSCRNSSNPCRSRTTLRGGGGGSSWFSPTLGPRQQWKRSPVAAGDWVSSVLERRQTRSTLCRSASWGGESSHQWERAAGGEGSHRAERS